MSPLERTIPGSSLAKDGKDPPGFLVLSSTESFRGNSPDGRHGSPRVLTRCALIPKDAPSTTVKPLAERVSDRAVLGRFQTQDSKGPGAIWETQHSQLASFPPPPPHGKARMLQAALFKGSRERRPSLVLLVRRHGGAVCIVYFCEYC